MSKGSEKSSGKKKNPQLPPEIEDKFKNVTIGIIAPTNVCIIVQKQDLDSTVIIFSIQKISIIPK
jgi:hypothetical protein